MDFSRNPRIHAAHPRLVTVSGKRTGVASPARSPFSAFSCLLNAIIPLSLFHAINDRDEPDGSSCCRRPDVQGHPDPTPHRAALRPLSVPVFRGPDIARPSIIVTGTQPSTYNLL